MSINTLCVTYRGVGDPEGTPFQILRKTQKLPMGKDNKKTPKKFHCIQNVSWFKIRGTNLVRSTRDRANFWKIPKSAYEERQEENA